MPVNPNAPFVPSFLKGLTPAQVAATVASINALPIELVFDAAATACDQQHIARAACFCQLACRIDGLRYQRCRTIALHRRRKNDQRQMRRTTSACGNNITQGGGLERSDDAERTRENGQRAFAFGGEEAFSFKLGAQFCEGLVEAAEPATPHRFDIELLVN